MIKRIVLITLATIIAMGFVHGSSYADSGDELESIQKKRENTKDDLSETEEDSKDLVSEMKDLNKDVKQSNAALEENKERIEKTEENIASTIKDIHTLQDDIGELEERMEKRYVLLKERLVSYQKSGGRVSYVDVVLGAEDFSDFTSRVSLVTKITDSDVALMEQFEKDAEDVEGKQELAMDKLDELNKVKQEQENAIASIDEERKNNEAKIEILGEKQHELTLLAANLEEEDNDLASLEKETKESIAAAEEATKKANHQAELEAKEKAKQEERKEQEKKQSEKKQHEKKLDNDNKEKNDKPDTEHDTDKNTEPDTDKDKDKDKNNDGKTFTVSSTAYTANCDGCSGMTTTGIDLKKNPDEKVIAVDPDVIPLGSLVHVEGYGYAIAGDTGGAIKGKKIDVFVPTKEEATKWGVRTVKVTMQ